MAHFRVMLVGVILGLGTVLVYLPVGHYGFAEYDDRDYVTQNPVVQAGLTWGGVEWAFTTAHASNWHPVTWLSHMLDCQLFGLEASGPHLVNVLFHSLNGVLLFVFLLRMTGGFWRSALVAALFAWHPLRVESVAWVAERKDVLCAWFGLLAMMAYVRYVQRRESQRGGVVAYGLALFFFGLGLMSKPMLVTLPFVLLLLDYWPLCRVRGSGSVISRWSGRVVEKWPFFVLAGASCVVTVLVQRRGEAVASLESYPLRFRLENGVVAYAEYLVKTVCPVDLSVIYPLPYPLPRGLPVVPVVAGAVTLTLISWVVWWRRGPAPYLVTGWLWYLGMLVPVIGLVQVGMQSMADRYTYLPQIGLWLGGVFGVGSWAVRLRLKPVVMVMVGGFVLGGCLMLTARQVGYWRDGETLFRHSLAVTQDNPVAQNNLGYLLLQGGHVDEAITLFQATLKLQPNNPQTYGNLGWALLAKGRLDEAIAQFQKALGMQPHSAVAHYNLGVAFAQKGQVVKAIEQYQKAADLQPDFAQARNNLGKALLQNERTDEAIVQFQETLKISPAFVEAYNNLAFAFLQKGQTNEAVTYFQKAVQINPRFPEAQRALGDLLLATGRGARAIAHYQTALELLPQDSSIQNNLAWILATHPQAVYRNGAKAVALAEEANQLSGGHNPAIMSTLAAAYAEAGRFGEAMATAQQAIELATTQNDTAMVGVLRTQLGFYEAHVPFRDASLTNGPTVQTPP